MSSLVIVESPAKAKTINKILGKFFTVKASVGHVRDLPSSKLGVDVENDFTPEYVLIPGKEKVIKELKAAAKKAEKIYLAPDPDREGEAIAFHIAAELSGGKKIKDNIFRVTFNEITSKAVKEAFDHAGKIDADKVDAQQARRVLDRLVGYGLSPLLWKKIRPGLSAGRVQSVAVRLVVEREREIEEFKKEEYWSIEVELEGSEKPEFTAKLHQYKGRPVIDRDAKPGSQFLIQSGKEAQAILDEIKAGKFALDEIEKKKKKRSPSPPFITSTLQQESSRKLHFSAKRTMMLAQQLYEGVELGDEGSVGLITYMRTDSVRVSSEAQAWAKKFIEEKYGKEFAPAAPPKYKSRSSAQEAHEAVRPTSASHHPDRVRQYLSRDLQKLYGLIWNRFIASQMSPAEIDQTAFNVSCANGTLRATGSIVTFKGFMALYTEGADEQSEEECCILPDLKKGEALKPLGFAPAQHFTQPPPRYTEATLVKTLEEKGIGRPSTYATILSTITDRQYVKKDDGRFAPTELGTVVNTMLVDKFPELLDIGFTAKMEDKLDKVEEGKLGWVKTVSEFHKPFSKNLDAATKSTERFKPKDIPTEEKCDKCGAPMIIKWGRHGRFFACSAYPECKNTRPLESEKPEGASEAEATSEVCEKCGSPMMVKAGRFGKFLACSAYPKCKNTRSISTGLKCPLDGGDIVERRTKRGKVFWSCSNYPKCKFASWVKPIAEKCPKCGKGILFVKKEKSGDLVRYCHDKEACGYEEKIKEEKS